MRNSCYCDKFSTVTEKVLAKSIDVLEVKKWRIAYGREEKDCSKFQSILDNSNQRELRRKV